MTNVRAFGATGDGTTDDTEAIQHAVRDGDGRIRFSRGTYRISQTIEIHLDETGRTGIEGDGSATLLMTGPGPAIRLIGTHKGTGDPKSVTQAVWDRQRMPTIRGIEITADHPEADGIELIETMQAIVDRQVVGKCVLTN